MRASISNEPEVLLDDAGVAQQANVKPRTVRKWRLENSLPYIRITKKVIRIRQSDLNRWLAKNLIGGVR